MFFYDEKIIILKGTSSRIIFTETCYHIKKFLQRDKTIYCIKNACNFLGHEILL